ncbi:MAG: succinate dehydrogenase, hydrophobic membrane anchor protein [Casimicrobium sp.]
MSGKSFTQEWWLQRISAVIIALYVLLAIVLLLVNGTPNYAQWQALFANNAFKAFTLLALIATFYHGLIGVLHVWPDYVKNAMVRSTLNAYSWIAAFGYGVYAIYFLFFSR